MSISKLKGISWDHPRGYQPLRAAAETWLKQTGVEVQWDVRTLKEFGDLPIEKLIDLYDLIIIDHPYMAEADANGLLLPLDKYLPADFINIQSRESVGPSFNSYKYNNSLYALPIDAASQVSAFRKDLTDSIGWGLPVDTLQLKDEAKQLPGKYAIAIPLCPTDIWCVFLTLCAQYSNGAFFDEAGINNETGQWALDQIKGWSPYIHKESYNMNPVQMLDHMSTYDEIIYSPFTFGYTNYSRVGFARKIIQFGDVPQYKSSEKTSLLGGAGIAISSKSEHLSACLDFVKYILDPEIQKTLYFNEGGQPGHLNAWQDENCNANSSNFFASTLYTIEHAFVRPKVPGFNKFQEKAAELIHDSVVNNLDADTAIRQLNNLYYKHCNENV